MSLYLLLFRNRCSPGALDDDIKLTSNLLPLTSLVCRQIGLGCPEALSKSATFLTFKPIILKTTGSRIAWQVSRVKLHIISYYLQQCCTINHIKIAISINTVIQSFFIHDNGSITVEFARNFLPQLHLNMTRLLHHLMCCGSFYLSVKSKVLVRNCYCCGPVKAIETLCDIGLYK